MYTTAYNHLSTEVSQFPEYYAQNRVISGGEARGTSDGIHNHNGSIIAEKWIPNWSGLIIEDRKKVMDERKCLGVRLGKCGKVEKGGNPGENNNINKSFRKMKNRIVDSKYRLRH